MPINLKNLRKKSKHEQNQHEYNEPKKISYRELADMIKGKTFNESQGIINGNYKMHKISTVDEFSSTLRKLEKSLNDSDIMLTAMIAVELCVQKAQLDYAYPLINNPFSMSQKIKYSELSERFLLLESLNHTIK